MNGRKVRLKQRGIIAAGSKPEKKATRKILKWPPIKQNAILGVPTTMRTMMMNITKITIARLYNLGNYEHVRYELTVEVKDGESAATAITAMEKLLEGLRPIGGISAVELAAMARKLAAMESTTALEWNQRYGRYIGTPEEVIDRHRRQLAEETAKAAIVKARARAARRLFDDLGGASVWEDAKLDWEDTKLDREDAKLDWENLG